MATNTGTEPGLRYDDTRRVAQKIWTLKTADTVGDWFDIGALTDVTIHVYELAAGAAGFNGATIKILGSNEEVPAASQANASPCDDLNGNAMAYTTLALEGVGPVPRFICPKVTAGTLGGTGVRIHLIARKQNRG